jgi:hypothetical protein
MSFSTTCAEQQKSTVVTQNLYTNVLNFNHIKEEYTFWFSGSNAPDLYRVHKSLVPDEVIEKFGKQDHYFTSFDQPRDDLFPVTKKSSPVCQPNEKFNGEEKNQKIHNASFSNSILRRFYNHRLFCWFKTNQLVKSDFVNDVEIWLKSDKKNEKFYIFEKYILKIQFAKITRKPELVVTYAGKSKIYKKSVADLAPEVSPLCFNWVEHNRTFYRYDDLPEEIKQNLDKVYPVWNFHLRDALNEETEAPDTTNRYKKFNDRINNFSKKYLHNQDFKIVLPLESTSFVKVPEIKISKVKDHSNQLLFGNQGTDIVPYNGLKNNGPFKTAENLRIQFFFIFHPDDMEVTVNLDKFFRNSFRSFRGLSNFVNVPYHTVEKFSITFRDKLNPLAQIESKIRNRDFNSDLQYMAIYVSPHSKSTSDKNCKKIYYRVKEILLKRGISSQVIDAGKVRQALRNEIPYDFFLNNIAIAILAKLNGVPWQLNTKLKRELVVGVGAFKSIDTDIHYLGSAFCFTNNGQFNQFKCFRKNEIDELAGSIISKVKEFAGINPDLSRLVIHFYKNMSKKELEPIEKGLRNLGLDIPVFIVSINKTESQDITAFDNNWKDLMPMSGTFINIGFNRFLLFNNIRYGVNGYKSSDGYPFPIKLSIKCTHQELENDYQIIKSLIDQVYQFSRIYWKSVRQQNLPVTIKYPELVAEIIPHFQSQDIDFGQENLWFL